MARFSIHRKITEKSRKYQPKKNGDRRGISPNSRKIWKMVDRPGMFPNSGKHLALEWKGDGKRLSYLGSKELQSNRKTKYEAAYIQRRIQVR